MAIKISIDPETKKASVIITDINVEAALSVAVLPSTASPKNHILEQILAEVNTKIQRSLYTISHPDAIKPTFLCDTIETVLERHEENTKALENSVKSKPLIASEEEIKKDTIWQKFKLLFK